MPPVALVTDTTCNMPPEMAAQLGVQIVPVYVNFGTQSFKDYEELPPAQFYERLAATRGVEGALPKTSQPSPEDFRRAYARCQAAGAAEIVSVHVTAKASGTCASAELAKTMIPEVSVHVVDSGSASMVISYMLLDAHARLQAGGSAADAVAAMEAVKANSALIFTVTDLEHLTSSGRTEGADKAVAAAIPVKPIIAVEGGVPRAVAQERTQKAALDRVLALAQERAGGRPARRLSIVNGNVAAKAQEWAGEAAAALNFAGTPWVVDFGPALAVHFGPGLMGVAVQWA